MHSSNNPNNYNLNSETSEDFKVYCSNNDSYKDENNYNFNDEEQDFLIYQNDNEI